VYSNDKAHAEGHLIDSRYRVLAELGRGGMARVYRVADERTGRELALKQLVASEDRLASLGAMFEHEYYTLRDLAHPNIVRVFDVGVDAERPFYTMELLDGVDVRQSAQNTAFSARDCCVLLRDCASALALIHSRRLVHRDVSPRNVWWSGDGRAKLIDFGTLIAMGPQTRVAGTPPYLPPEALVAQPLDARSDLYALGALAYYAVTRRNAYPARTLDELPSLWQLRVERPDVLNKSLPSALSELILMMLSPDPRGRPMSAAEVYERATAIGGLPDDRDVAAAQAYLTTPALVGREKPMSSVRKRLREVMQGRGSTVPVVAAAGLGRSRLLATVRVEAKMRGALAVSADAGAASDEAFALAGALVERLLESAPLMAAQASEHAPVLAHLSPAVRAALGNVMPAELSAFQRTRKLAAAIVALFRIACEHKPLVVVADDVHRADNASIGVLGRLSLLAEEQQLLLVISCDEAALGAAQPGLETLFKQRHRIRLEPLAAADTRELVESVFGAGGGLDTTASWLHELSAGNPQTCMRYAQYLVDERLARYEAGQWTLPAQLKDFGAPPSLRTMFERTIAGLSPDARTLALGLALARDDSRAVWQADTAVKIEDFATLLGSPESSRVYAAIDELVRAGVMQQRDSLYVLSQRAMIDVLIQSSDEATRRQLHLRIAKVFEREIYLARWLVVRHLQLAGEQLRAREVTLEYATRIAKSPAEWGSMRVSMQSECAQRALADWEKHGGSPREAITLRQLLLMVSSVYDWSLARFGVAQLAQLRRDCGLDRYAETNREEPPLNRVFTCLKWAGERHEALPEAERGLPPLDALREVASCVMLLSGAYINSHDVAGTRAMPEVLEPLRPLSPLLGLLADICTLTIDRATGREIGDRLLDIGVTKLIASEGLPETLRQGAAGVNVHIQAVEFARRGRSVAYDVMELLVPTIGEDMFLVVHGRWLGRAFQGQSAQAEKFRKQLELMTDDDVWRRKSFLFAEAELHALTGDYAKLRGVVEAIGALVEKFDGWRPWLAFAEGSMHRVRGDANLARAAFDTGLRLAAAGEHRAWTRIAPASAELTLTTGDAAQALREAEKLVEVGKQLALDRYVELSGERISALAKSALKDHAGAAAAMQRAYAVATAIELGGLPLASLHAAAAQIALAADDPPGCGAALAKLWGIIETAEAPALVHAYESLRAESRQQLPVAKLSSQLGTTHTSFADSLSISSSIQERLTTVTHREGRFEHALELLLQDSGVGSGHFFVCRGDELSHASTLRCELPTPELLRHVESYVRDALDDVRTQTFTGTDDVADKTLRAELFDGPRGFAPVLIWSRADDQLLLVGVLLLEAGETGARAPRAPLVRIISQFLISTGDCTGLTVHD
jgi:eukaryotic-like serine/threonine-protein kinase